MSQGSLADACVLYIVIYPIESNPAKTTSIMRHLGYNVRYSAVPINSALSTVILSYSVRTALLYNDTSYSALQ
jgi:hypothetical protein